MPKVAKQSSPNSKIESPKKKLAKATKKNIKSYSVVSTSSDEDKFQLELGLKR
jgi:hypothetical protein